MNTREALKALQDTAAEVLPQVLRFEPGVFVEDEGAQCGTWIAVHIGEDAVYLGLIASWPARRALARALLGLHSSRTLDDHQVADAVNELLNLLAGRVKANLQPQEGVRLGLPFTLAQAAPAAVEAKMIRSEVVVGPVCFGFAAAGREGEQAA